MWPDCLRYLWNYRTLDGWGHEAGIHSVQKSVVKRGTSITIFMTKQATFKGLRESTGRSGSQTKF